MEEKTILEDIEVPVSFDEGFRALAKSTGLRSEVLRRLAYFDFLVKFKVLTERSEEREKYDYLYNHFEKERIRATTPTF